MRTLYIITGPAGVGKSTISKLLADRLKKSALIEGDDIYHFVKGGYVSPWKEGNHLEVFWNNCVDIINNFIEKDYDVIFNYIIKKDDLNRLVSNLPSVKIKFILLVANEEELIKRDLERDEDSQMGERVLILLNELKNENYDNRYVLDTTSVSVNEIVEEILDGNNFCL